MANQRDLKAFVRYDGSGRVVAGSLVLRKKKPKVGRWEEILTYECCNPTTTTTTTGSGTTTTSSSTSTTTTTLPIISYKVGLTPHGSFAEACGNTFEINIGTNLYGQGNTYQAGTQLYNDSNLTSPSNVTGWFPSMIGWPSGSATGMYIDNGVLQAGLPCN